MPMKPFKPFKPIKPIMIFASKRPYKSMFKPIWETFLKQMERENKYGRRSGKSGRSNWGQYGGQWRSGKSGAERKRAQRIKPQFTDNELSEEDEADI
jgi:hypothetical protein